MLQLITPSNNFRAFVFVIASHALILWALDSWVFSTINKGSNVILAGLMIELESASMSKVVARQSKAQERSPKNNTMIQSESLAGQKQVVPVHDDTATAAPISMPSLDSIALSNPKPPYPISSRENGEQGRVYLSACINERGKIERLDLAKSSGHVALDRSALNTVRHWEFIPAYQHGKPIPICYRLPINFILASNFNIAINQEG